MKILVTNDDGIFSQGIISLAEILKDMGEVYVVAPNTQRSGEGHGITVNTPLIITETDYPAEVKKAYSVSGKPVDCIRVALNDLLPDRPDLIVSGINEGPNYGQDVFYSGTVSAAIEGMFYGIPSLAFSLDGSSDEIGRRYIPEIIDAFLKSNTLNRTIWNVNLPSCPEKEYRGMRIAPLSGHSQYPVEFKKYQSALREWYYFPVAETVGVLEEGTDVDYVKKGYIAITPLTVDYSQK